MADVMYGTKEETDFLYDLMGAVERQTDAQAMAYTDTGLMTTEVGCVVRFEDGREFQVTIVQSGGDRTDED